MGERVRGGEEDNKRRRVRREGAFEDMVKNESGACVDGVFYKDEATVEVVVAVKT